jgi:hypothetical protein
MSPKISPSVDNKKSSSSASSEDAPFLTTIMSIEYHLTIDTKNLALAVSNINAMIDKVVSVSTLLETPLC